MIASKAIEILATDWRRSPALLEDCDIAYRISDLGQCASGILRPERVESEGTIFAWQVLEDRGVPGTVM